jgi:hypothetical protein
MNLFENIKLLPNDLIKFEVLPFISNDILLFTCKKYYEENIVNYRLKNDCYSYRRSCLVLDSYIKKIIINKFNYIFSLLIQVKYEHWKKLKKYKYKGWKYKTYIDVLEHICVELDSTKCRNCIIYYKKKNDFVRKNKHKKMRRINNIWSN